MVSHTLRSDTWKLLFVHYCICGQFSLPLFPCIYPPWTQILLLNCVKVTLFTAKYEMEVFVKSLPYPVWFLSKKILKLKRLREGAFPYNLIICWQCTYTCKGIFYLNFVLIHRYQHKENSLSAAEMQMSWVELNWKRPGHNEPNEVVSVCKTLTLCYHIRLRSEKTSMKCGTILFFWTSSDDPRCPRIIESGLFIFELHSNIYPNCWLWGNLFIFS